ncbi:MAG: ribosome silencing factor [Pacificimonas sp.]
MPAANLPDADSTALHDLVLSSLDDDKAVDVVDIPLAGKSEIADHMVIASGRSSRQVAAMAQKLSERVKQQLSRPVRLEGLPAADWVLVDAGDVVVHLFRPEVRSFYNLEKMWGVESPVPEDARPDERTLEGDDEDGEDFPDAQ